MERAAWWDRLHEVGRKHGLQPLSFEKPHLQLAGPEIGQLQSGAFPPGGDADWLDNLVWNIESWDGEPEAPASPAERPGL